MSVLSSPVKGLSHIQLRVSDVALSERWYSLVLGLERMTAGNEEDKEGTYVALLHRLSKMVVVLSLGADPASSAAPPSGASSDASSFGPAPDRIDHIAFFVPDARVLTEWADQLRDQHVEHSGVVDEDGRPSLMLTDPDGIQIELVAPTRSRPSVL
jgi:catechol 2,3-dioxygenase-like lactoylglutathione lyase family enzyme